MSITAPFNLIAIAVSTGEIDLSWSASVASGGVLGDFQPGDFLSGDFVMGAGVTPVVTGYLVFRNGVQIASLGNVLSFADTGLQPSTTYSYFVKGVDSASEVSLPSNTATARTLARPVPPIVIPPGFQRRQQRNLYPLYPIPEHTIFSLPVPVIGKYIRVYDETQGPGLCVGDFDPTLGMFWLDVFTGLPIGGIISPPITR